MKVSLNWLKELANIEIEDLDNLTSQLTQAGFEVEDIESIVLEDQIDHILDISSTANRSDVLSMIGLSRELLALTKSSTLQVPNQIIDKFFSKKSNVLTDHNLLHCNDYFSAVIDGIEIIESPDWLKNRLLSSGFTSKNLLVDISNYIMLKWGQPINIIDFGKVNYKNNITIQSNFYAGENTEIELDNKNIKLRKNILVTKVNDSITGIAGIVANHKFETDFNTTSIFLESAIFKQSIVRQSSRFLNIRTESSVRQERGLNIDNWENAYLEALSLITDLAGGNIREIFSKKKTKKDILHVNLSIKRVQDILGPISHDNQIRFLYFQEIQDILHSLNFTIIHKTQETIKIEVPNYRRQDVFREVDIIEEIARIYGYHKFKSSLPSIQFNKKSSKKRQFIDKSRNILRNLGLTELVHYSLVKSLGDISLNNPLIQDYSNLRCSLIEGLIESNLYNLKQSSQTIDSFEIGTVFNTIQNKIVETTNLATILGGNLDIRSTWSQPVHSLNWYEAKGIVENFFQKIDRRVEWRKQDIIDNRINLIQKNKSAVLIYNNTTIGIFSELNQEICSQLGLNTKLFVLEVNLNILEDSHNQFDYLNYQIRPYSKYPSIIRDLSLIVPQDMEISYLLKVLDQFNDKDLESTKLFDQYTNKSIGKQKKSIGLRFTYRSSQKTLTNLEIDHKQSELQKKIIQHLNLEIRQ
nr:phenylalanyl-tRNA synthetase beta chain [Neoporphyra perforata]AGV01113.1 phenylalanyl-tRNA synthetase beta chain [Neoporphyra perforata]AIA19495.1 phenylalanyl-tRNA synthetase beta chain [Neoporphyra perforata]AIA19704.1 phenylalanyl-tRNA synthetase beta chain [Neoporphyra perforata]AIA19913.1 phenylalanyl-tRNA synthetase beta chain [Neoporphyra perforata]AIA20331.1 phenylalanyl-tRNA synthetase beta chain [Neoporphyra perforata]